MDLLFTDDKTTEMVVKCLGQGNLLPTLRLKQEQKLRVKSNKQTKKPTKKKKTTLQKWYYYPSFGIV